MFVVTTILIPIVILSMMSISAYILPPDSGDKAAIQVSLMLSFSVFVLIIADGVPPTEYTPFVCKYLVLARSE